MKMDRITKLVWALNVTLFALGAAYLLSMDISLYSLGLVWAHL